MALLLHKTSLDSFVAVPRREYFRIIPVVLLLLPVEVFVEVLSFQLTSQRFLFVVFQKFQVIFRSYHLCKQLFLRCSLAEATIVSS